ncbi:MAG: hypothetical protein HQ518_12415 [Rhodopirellula sp.]|nr:hypothetical protein [Rhodopirellula sp.]
MNQRSRQVMEAFSVDPQASINGSFARWEDTLAAYRLFDNPAVTPEAILQPHYQATRERIGEHPVVLIVQDTTELDFTRHPPRGAGCLNKLDRFGLYDHTHLAVTPDGLPLGVVGTHVFDRSAESLGKTLQRRGLPIEEKESYRWLQGYRLAWAATTTAPQVRNPFGSAWKECPTSTAPDNTSDQQYKLTHKQQMDACA